MHGDTRNCFAASMTADQQSINHRSLASNIWPPPTLLLLLLLLLSLLSISDQRYVVGVIFVQIKESESRCAGTRTQHVGQIG